MTVRISPTLSIAGPSGDICCNACNHSVASHRADVHWKDKVVVVVEQVQGTAGWSDSVHPELVLRKFVCPSCGHLLDSEVALPEDPFLYDVVMG